MLTSADHIRWARCPPDAIAVLDLRHGTWHMLEGLGARIWAALAARGSSDGLADEIAAVTGAGPAVTRTAVDAYVQELLTTGLMVDTSAPPRGTTHRARRRRRQP